MNELKLILIRRSNTVPYYAALDGSLWGSERSSRLNVEALFWSENCKGDVSADSTVSGKSLLRLLLNKANSSPQECNMNREVSKIASKFRLYGQWQKLWQTVKFSDYLFMEA